MEDRPLATAMEDLLAHSAWVWQLARRLVDDDEQARDVVQEAWLRALRRPPRLKGAKSARPWLQVVVRNIATQLRRSEHRRDAREREAAKPEALPPADRVRAREEARRVVVEAVLALPEPYREAIVLRYFDELSPAAIAARLGVPGSTVRSRLQRAHEMLRTRLASQRCDDASSWLAALTPLLPARTPLGGLPLGAVILNTKLILLGGAAVVVALAVWLVVSSNSQREPTASASSPPLAAPTDPRDADAFPAQREPATSEPGEDIASTANANSPPSVRVQVVERTSGRPLPGASVLYAAIDDVGANASGDLERELAERGQQIVADGNGRVEFPYRGRWMHVAARSGDLWGSTAATDERPDTLVLELFRDREVAVQVVDQAGQPVVGVPLVLASVGASSANRSWSGLTEAPLGIARIRHFDLAVPRLNALGEVVVQLAYAQTGSEGVRIDLAELPSEPLRLELPPHGSLRVRLLDERGQRVLVRHQLQVSTVSRPASPRSVTGIEGGEGVVPFVGLDLELSLVLFPMTPGSHDGLEHRARSPARAGEEVLIEIPVPEHPPLPRGLAVDARSLPLAQRELNCWVHAAHDAAAGAYSRVRTDDDGLFELDVQAKQFADQELVLLATASATDTCDALEGSLGISARQLRRGSSLGELRMLPAPLLASGRVVDEHDRPIARATVELLRRGAVGSAAVQQAQVLAQLGYAAGANEWQPAPLRTAKTDEEGRFVLHGAEAPGQLALRARASDHCGMEPLPIATGASEVVLRLARAGAVAGSFRLVHPSLANVLSLRARPSNDDDASQQRSAAVAHDGHFRIDELRPGPVRIAVTLGPHGGELLLIDGVVAKPGETVRDPRLVGISLDGLVHVFDFDVVSSADRPVPAGVIAYGPAGTGASSGFEAPIRSGRATIVSDSHELDLAFHAPGFRVREERLRAGRTRVMLENGFELALRLPRALSLADDLSIEAELRAPPGAPSFDSTRVRVRGEGLSRTALAREGEWTILWYLQRPGRSARRLLRNAPLEISERSAPREVVLELTQAELDAAAAELRAKQER